MINFSIENDLLLLHYESDRSEVGWVFDKLKNTKNITLRKSFYFTKNDLYEENNSVSDAFDNEEVATFILGKKKDNITKLKGIN